jgi:hypothetical protein
MRRVGSLVILTVAARAADLEIRRLSELIARHRLAYYQDRAGTRRACMRGPDNDGETGLLDLAELSLDDLSLLDDSVVANAIRALVERRRCGAEHAERFQLFNSAG